MTRPAAPMAGHAVLWHQRRWKVVDRPRRGRVLVTDGFEQGVVLVTDMVWENWADAWLVWPPDDVLDPNQEWRNELE